jgi:hypothetical protein
LGTFGVQQPETCSVRKRIYFKVPKRKDEAMPLPREYVVPVTVAVVIALICVGTVYFMDFRLQNVVQDEGPNMITTAVVEQAGATITPTQLSTEPPKPVAPVSGSSAH